jgi:isoaspartyl peptidase/L-asparaginase-like protein (Ntn-hydrolase superfamily)
MDVDLARKVIESSPVIVLLVLAATVMLWRKGEARERSHAEERRQDRDLFMEKLDDKDANLMALQREVITVARENTAAMNSLRDAIARGERRP